MRDIDKRSLELCGTQIIKIINKIKFELLIKYRTNVRRSAAANSSPVRCPVWAYTLII